MPCLRIFTNVPKNQIPADFAEKIVPILSRTVGKPEEKFTVLISGDNIVSSFGKHTGFSAVGSLESIGHIDPIRNQTVSKEVSDYVFKTIGVKPEHFFLSFYDVLKSNIGVAGSTAAVLEP